MTQCKEELLNTFLPGTEIAKKLPQWGEKLERPIRFWRSDGSEYAVFSIEGELISQAKIDSIKRAHELNLLPLVVITDHSQLSAMAACYLDTLPYLAYSIAGQCKIISPPPQEIINSTSNKKTEHRSRIPIGLLNDILKADDKLPNKLKTGLRNLLRKYEKLKKAANKDDYEQKILESFGNTVLRDMGFTEARLQAASGIRSLELSKMITDRDHYFHSFQNYFLGLLPITRLKTYYQDWKTTTKLGWEVNSFDVWFLTALWHDVGYGIQKHPEFSVMLYDAAEVAEFAETLKDRYLETPETQLAVQDISSALPRFLEPEGYFTTWVRPSYKTKPTAKQRRMANVLKTDFIESHGAASAFMLHRQLIAKVDRMDDDATRDVLFHTVMTACCSIPFHDWRFRKTLMETYGSFFIKNGAMPFAATLAFIDSIQEDRRELTEIWAQMRFLERLIVNGPRYVKAKLNLNALEDEDVLWKIIESRDVCGVLLESDDSISFKYPPWMTN